MNVLDDVEETNVYLACIQKIIMNTGRYQYSRDITMYGYIHYTLYSI